MRLVSSRPSFIEVEVDAALVSDSGKMEHGVCAAAESHVHGQGIAEGSLGHDVAGLDVLLKQLHDLHAGALCKLDSL